MIDIQLLIIAVCFVLLETMAFCRRSL